MNNLISDKLVKLVENNTEEILKRWITRLVADPKTSTYSKENIEYIENEAKIVLTNLNKWVNYDTAKEDVGKKYSEHGKEYFDRKIPLCEVVRSLFVLRRTLWLFVLNESAFDSAFQLNQMRELSDRVILFFDRTKYYAIRGYQEEMNKKIKELWNLTDEDTKKIFFGTSFYN